MSVLPFTFVMLDVGGGEEEEKVEEKDEEEKGEGNPEVLAWLLCLLLL